MCNFKIIILLTLFLLSGCGKSPLFNKLEKTKDEISGGMLLSERLPVIKRSFDLKWVVSPTLDDLSSFEIEFDASLEADHSVHAYLWMPDMGHGSSPIEITSSDSLHYTFSELAFIMPGLWVLHLEILKNNQVIDQWQKSITL